MQEVKCCKINIDREPDPKRGPVKMPESFNDPRRLFRLWKEYSGEDLLNQTPETNERKSQDASNLNERPQSDIIHQKVVKK